jgi:hypothetical protein
MAKMDAWIEEMKACVKKVEANPYMLKSAAVHKEIPKEHGTVKPVGGLGKRCRSQNLVIGHYQEPKEWTQGNCGSWKKLAACRMMTCHAGVAQHKGYHYEGPTVKQGRKNPNRDKFARGTPERMDTREETMDSPGRQHRNKEPRPETDATSRKHEEMQQNLQEDHRAGDRKVNSWIFCQNLKNEGLDIVEGLASLRNGERVRTRSGSRKCRSTSPSKQLCPSVKIKRS